MWTAHCRNVQCYFREVSTGRELEVWSNGVYGAEHPRNNPRGFGRDLAAVVARNFGYLNLRPRVAYSRMVEGQWYAFRGADIEVCWRRKASDADASWVCFGV
jgi:hypothetical protein